MRAKKMFEKLGFRQTKNGAYNLEYTIFDPRGNHTILLFQKQKRRIKINQNLLKNFDDNLDFMGIALSKTIKKQVKELEDNK